MLATGVDGPAAVVRRFVEETIGPVDRYRERTVPYGEALVWSVEARGEIVAWLKRHKHLDKALREADAYRDWLPQIGWGTVPLLGVCPKVPRAILTTPAVGERADRAALSTQEEQAVYRELGRFLSALHSLPVPDPDPTPVGETLQQCAEHWCARAEDIVDSEIIDAVRGAFDMRYPSDLKRVPCHRDLHLHNLIISREAGRIGVTVIDFGQARLDLWLSDLVKLFAIGSADDLAHRRALLEGYGRRLTTDEAEILVRLRMLQGLVSWIWASDHGDLRGLKQARHIVETALETARN